MCVYVLVHVCAGGGAYVMCRKGEGEGGDWPSWETRYPEKREHHLGPAAHGTRLQRPHAVGSCAPHLLQAPLLPAFKIRLKIPLLHGTSLTPC